MSLELLSKYRKQLMAIAMIWIAFYHSFFPIKSKAISFVLVTCGYGGVDLFVFLSSFGLYYAYKKDNNYWHFIKRGLLRILPYSIPILFITSIINKETVLNTIGDCLGFSLFFRTDLFNWFTSFILVMYFLTPLYLSIFKKNPNIVTMLSIIMVFVLCLIRNNSTFSYVVFRTAVFVLGLYFAYINDQKNTTNKDFIFCIILMIVGWLLMYYCYHHFGNQINHVYPMIFITPGLLLLLAWLMEKINVFNNVLGYIGDYTFQFYLIHPIVLKVLYDHYGDLYISGIGFDYWINVAGMALGFVLSVFYKKLIDTIMKSFQNREASKTN